MFELIGLAVFGLVVGAIAKLIMPGKDPGGFIITALIGMAGSLLATFVGRSLGWYNEGQSAQWIGSIVGTILLLAIYRIFVGRRSA